MENFISHPLPDRVSLDDARRYVILWRQSGLTRQQFCEAHDIPFARLRSWVQRVDMADRATAAPPFVPAKLASPHSHDDIELCLPGDIRIACSLAKLPAVLQVLRHAAA
ncbi:MAG TPA: IS66 family insertion sequence element accessory protein TnpB [Buttiauxella sp.]|jgi:hypothetical protein